jgi:LacI family transcriptional regulator
MHSSKRKNILLFIWERDVSAREFLAGFTHYSNSGPLWSVRILYAADALLPSTTLDIAAGRYDGIVLTDTFLAAHPEFGCNPSTAITVIGDISVCKRRPNGIFTSVNIDNPEIGRIGADFLMSLGAFSCYAFVPPTRTEAWDCARVEGFRKSIESAKRRCEIYNRSTPLDAWLAELPKPVALMAACDYTAIEVMSICARLSLRIPQDISIIGVDDDELLCESVRPPLSSIRPSHFASGFQTGRALNELFRTGVGAKRKTKPILCSDAKIIERESTRYLPPAVHLISAATNYIKANVCEKISVGDVVRHLGVSRRLADLRFHEYSKMSINETITEIKLKELATRLLTSKRSIRSVAAALNFHDLSYLGRLFRKRFGMTMFDWRAGKIPRQPKNTAECRHKAQRQHNLRNSKI